MGISPMDGLTSVPPLAGRVAASASRLQRVKKAWITFYETLKLSLDALRAHKLRSFLTLLGVILAVTTLVFVMSVIAGLNMYVADRVANLGANVFIVDRFGIITSRDEFIKAQKRPLITMDDYQRLHDGMRLARSVAAEEDRNVQTRVGDIIMENTSIMGTTANFADVRNLNIVEGRFITPADDEHRSDVAFIGSDLAAKFFPNSDPLGKSIRVGTHSYQVIGVAEAIGSAFGQSQDNYMIMPMNTFLKGWHRQTDWATIFIQAPIGEVDERPAPGRSLYFSAPGAIWTTTRPTISPSSVPIPSWPSGTTSPAISPSSRWLSSAYFSSSAASSS